MLRYMSVSATNKQVYDLDETAEIYDHLMELPIEFRQYKRYNKLVNVPRGQLAFTLTPEVHYDYGRTAGGTPSVLVTLALGLSVRVHTPQLHTLIHP